MPSEVAVDSVVAPRPPLPQILVHPAASQGNPEPPQRKYKDGWWTGVGRQSLSRRPPGPIPALLRQSDLWARAVAAAAVAEKPPSRSKALKAKVRGLLAPTGIGSKTSPSETFPRALDGVGRELATRGPKKALKTIYGSCFGIIDGSGKELGKKKQCKGKRLEFDLVDCCSVPNGRTFWSSSERVHSGGEGLKRSSVVVEGSRSCKVGQVSNRECKKPPATTDGPYKKGPFKSAISEFAALWR